MKILILGRYGLVGNQMYEYFKGKYETYGTARKNYSDYEDNNVFIFEHNENKLEEIINKVNPDIVVNCIAILSQSGFDLDNKIKMIYANCVLPLIINRNCKKSNIYFIHLSTDAIFKSSDNYNKLEDQISPTNFYAITKCLSEELEDNSLVIRCCPVGINPFKTNTLLSWFLNTEQKELNGYKNAYFNGITTLELAKQINKIILNPVYGKIQLAGPKISKYELLLKVNDIVGLNKKINPIENPKICKLLDTDLNLDWDVMLRELII